MKLALSLDEDELDEFELLDFFVGGPLSFEQLLFFGLLSSDELFFDPLSSEELAFFVELLPVDDESELEGEPLFEDALLFFFDLTARLFAFAFAFVFAFGCGAFFFFFVVVFGALGFGPGALP